jgi:hypothetical protein
VDEKGSALVEFVALALPLFIPLFIFLGHYGQRSDMEAVMRSLSREMARAFVTGTEDSMAFAQADKVFEQGGEILGLQQDLERNNLKYSIACRNFPCISPDNEVVITLTTEDPQISIASVEYVSPWT